MLAKRRAALVSLIVVAITNAAFAREWKDVSGSKSREGQFVAYHDGQVIVRLADGREASAALERFSEADQDYVRSIASAKSASTVASTALAKSSAPVRMANYQTNVAPPANPPQTLPPGGPAAMPSGAGATAGAGDRTEEEIIAKYGDKFVFRTCCGRFHIILCKDADPTIGTAHYAFRYWCPPCCGCCCYPCCGPWYLSFLRKTAITWSYIEAEEFCSALKIVKWRFWWVPNCCDQYKITYTRNGTDWYLFDYACRTEPK